MAQISQDTLGIALRLLRLRDMMGNNRITDVLVSQLQHVTHLNQIIIKQYLDPSNNEQTDTNIKEILREMFGSSQDLVTYYIEQSQKFIMYLNLLHLNTEKESSMLQDFRSEWEQRTEEMGQLENKLVELVDNPIVTKAALAEVLGEESEFQMRLQTTAKKLTELSERLEDRVADVLTMVGQMASTINRNQLFEAFTQPP